MSTLNRISSRPAPSGSRGSGPHPCSPRRPSPYRPCCRQTVQQAIGRQPGHEGARHRGVQEGIALPVGRHGPLPLRLLGPDALLVQARGQASCRARPPRSTTAPRTSASGSRRVGDLVFFHSGSVGLPRRHLRRRRQHLARSEDGREGPAGAHLVQQRLVRPGELTRPPNAAATAPSPCPSPGRPARRLSPRRRPLRPAARRRPSTWARPPPRRRAAGTAPPSTRGTAG